MRERLRRSLGEPEVIGPPECPILHRWTLLGRHAGGPAREVSGQPKYNEHFKVLLHRFLPNSADRDPHDHPRSFLTIVLAGGYNDGLPCTWCDGTGWMVKPAVTCSVCRGTGFRVGDRLRRGSVRYRSAEHVHVTKAGPDGAWTLVIMGPLRRHWGFWRDGVWWPWRKYADTFDHGMRCP